MTDGSSSDWAKKGLDVQNELIDLVDKDTDAFKLNY